MPLPLDEQVAAIMEALDDRGKGEVPEDVVREIVDPSKPLPSNMNEIANRVANGEI